VFLVITAAGFFIFLRSSYVKAKFRQTPHDPCFTGIVQLCSLAVNMILNYVRACYIV